MRVQIPPKPGYSGENIKSNIILEPLKCEAGDLLHNFAAMFTRHIEFRILWQMTIGRYRISFERKA